MTWFLYAGRESLGLCVSIKIDLVFVWVVEIDLISVWGVAPSKTNKTGPGSKSLSVLTE